MVLDPQLSRLKMSLRQVELNKNAASEKRASFRQSCFSRQKKVKPASITECPQNAVELRKLINTWTDIDNAQKKSVSKIDSAKFNLKLEYEEMLSGKISDSKVNLLLPPGFRFHANGEPKQRKSLVRVSHLYKSSEKPRSKSFDSVEKVKIANETDSTESPKKAIEEEIKETEIALEEIHNDRQLHAISRKISQMKASLKYIRAHSASDIARQRDRSPSKRREDNLTRRISTSGSPTKAKTKSQNDAGSGFLRGTVSTENKRLFPSTRWNSQKNQLSSSMEEPARSPLQVKNRESSANGPKVGIDRFKASPGKSVPKGMEIKRIPSKSAPHPSKRSERSRIELTQSMPSPERQKLRKSMKNEPENNRISFGTRDRKLIKRPTMEMKCRSKPAWDKMRRVSESSSTSSCASSEELMDLDKSDDSVLKISTEESYRRMMRKASISDEQKLAKLSEMMDGVAVGGSRRKSSTMCHINARQNIVHRQSSSQLVSRDKPARPLEALKSMVELETKSSRSKVQDFLRRLPTPDVTIRRWRTSKGDMQVIERRCKEPNEDDPESPAGAGHKKKKKRSMREEGDVSDSDHASVSTTLSVESEDSEKLAINTALTSWPTHWAQRAAFHTDCTPDQEKGGEEEEKDPEKEFRKLLKCRYLRIPAQMLKRNSSILSTTSSQAWK